MMKKTKKQEFLELFDNEKLDAIEISLIPDFCHEEEKILNPKANLPEKRKYYERAYNDELELIANNKIKIVSYRGFEKISNKNKGQADGPQSSLENVYLLQIKRSNFSNLEVIAICESSQACKDMVKFIHDSFKKFEKQSEQEVSTTEDYDPHFWEIAKQNENYEFYCLNNSGTAYFQIVNVPFNKMALPVQKPTQEQLEKFVNSNEQYIDEKVFEAIEVLEKQSQSSNN